MKRTVQVDGSGRAEAEPDIVQLSVTASATRDSMREAYAAATEATARVRTALAAAGLGADAVTRAVRFEPEWRGDGQPQRYIARQTIGVLSRDVAGASEVVAALVEAGGDEAAIDSLAYAVEKPAALDEQARSAAFADARSRAEAFAAQAGGSLGRVLAVVEGGGGGMPVFRAAKMSADAGGMAFESGTVAAEAYVTVTWQLTHVWWRPFARRTNARAGVFYGG